MEEKDYKVSHKCLWYDQCECLEICEYYTPIDDDLTDEELLENKYNYRKEFFEFAEEMELYDN